MPKGRNMHKHYKTAASGTVKQLLVPSRLGHGANFSRILPSAMDQLLKEGLFIRDENAEGGFRITEKGLAKLKDLEVNLG